MKKFTNIILGIMLSAAFHGCKSFPSRSLYIPGVSLSDMHDTTLFFDFQIYDGFGLKVRNDLDSDIFLINAPWTPFIPEPYNTKKPFRLPDRDERLEHSRYEIRMSASPGSKPPHFEMPPHYFRYSFIYIWSGNTGSFHHFSDRMKAGGTYFLPITYYDTAVGGFHTRSIRIVVSGEP